MRASMCECTINYLPESMRNDESANVLRNRVFFVRNDSSKACTADLSIFSFNANQTNELGARSNAERVSSLCHD